MTPYAVILAGRSGPCFWPRSWTTYPKQFLTCGGSWRSLVDLYVADSDSKVVIGHHLGRDATGLVAYGPDMLTATFGLSSLIIGRMHDALLIYRKDRDQEVRDLADRLRQRGQTDAL
jgi:mannose-1-phosphate guanylyltransferase